MKRLTWIVGLALAALAQWNAAALAQQSAAGTRVAVVNVGQIFSKYEKAKFYKAELESTLKPFKEKGEAIQGEYKKYGEAFKKNAATMKPQEKEQYENYLLKLKRDMEDLDAQARKLIGKKQEDQIVMLFKEVCGGIQAYAQANGFHLVLGYGQQIDGDIYSFANINRVMQGMDLGSTTPLFLVGGVDISQPVVDNLNRMYQSAGGAAAPTVPAVPTSNTNK